MEHSRVVDDLAAIWLDIYKFNNDKVKKQKVVLYLLKYCIKALTSSSASPFPKRSFRLSISRCAKWGHLTESLLVSAISFCTKVSAFDRRVSNCTHNWHRSNTVERIAMKHFLNRELQWHTISSDSCIFVRSIDFDGSDASLSVPIFKILSSSNIQPRYFMKHSQSSGLPKKMKKNV